MKTIIALLVFGSFFVIGGITVSLPALKYISQIGFGKYLASFLLNFLANPAGMLGVVLLAWGFIKLKKQKIKDNAQTPYRR